MYLGPLCNNKYMTEKVLLELVLSHSFHGNVEISFKKKRKKILWGPLCACVIPLYCVAGCGLLHAPHSQLTNNVSQYFIIIICFLSGIR